MGSASLFFRLAPPRAVLGDVNQDLVATFIAVREAPEAVYKAILQLPRSRREYYAVRALKPEALGQVDRAARFIFLNRFCFNGLYRTNKKGMFNVPFSPEGSVPSLSVFLQASEMLGKARLISADFEDTAAEAGSRDFVYLDPPYAVSNRRVFCQYNARAFAIVDLERLSNTLVKLNKKGAGFLVSYALCREALIAFDRWKVRVVFSRRNISGFAEHRRRAAELLITNVRPGS